MEARRFDLVILGSGSTAFAAAIRATELGKTAVMTENRTLGELIAAPLNSFAARLKPRVRRAADVTSED